MALFGLFIGNDYKGTADELPDCELDAERWHRALGPLCKTKILLTGKDASRNAVIYAWNELNRQATGRDDCIAAINSGHGTFENKHGRRVEAIVLHDFELIYDYEMDELVGRRPTGAFAWLFSDSCFSFGMARGLHAHPSPSRVRAIHFSKVKAHPIRKTELKRPMPRVVFTAASDASEESFSTGHGGAASIEYLKAIKDLGAGAQFGQLFEQLRKALPSDRWPQHPRCEASPADLKRTFISFAQPPQH